VSNTLIHQNTEVNTLEITIKIFSEDLNHLRENLKTHSQETNYEFDTNEYIQKNFKLTVNKKLVKLVPLGREVENELVYCYYEVHEVINIQTLEIENTILFDLFEDQINMIDIELPKFKKRILLEHNHSKETVQ